MASSPITSWQIEVEKEEAVTDFLFLGSQITADGDCSHEIRRQLFLGRKAMTNLDSVEKQRHYSVDKGPYSQGYALSNGHLWLWEPDCKEGRVPKKWCLWIVVLEKTPESPLNSKEIKSVNLKGDQPWILIGRTDAEAEAPVFCLSDMNSQLIGQVPVAGKDRGQKENGVRGWDGWMASPMQWTWPWATSGRWWGTGRPGLLQSMGSQRVRYNWATEQQQQILFQLWANSKVFSIWVEDCGQRGLETPPWIACML